MGDLIPSLADLIVPLITINFPEIDWGEPAAYAPESIIVGRYRGGFTISVGSDRVTIRNVIKPIMAADPEFVTKLTEGILAAKSNIEKLDKRCLD
jgi:hypothetical protein